METSHESSAGKLTEILLDGIEDEQSGFKGRSSERMRAIENAGSGIYTADVTSSVDRFRNQFSVASRYDLPIPCYYGINSGPVPIDFLPTYGGSKYSVSDPSEYEFHLSSLFRESAGLERMEQLQAFSALKSFKEKLSDFLASRFQARDIRRKNIERFFRFITSKSEQEHVEKAYRSRFTVYSRTTDCRVHYSPAYFVNLTTVFGSPTSPVKGWIRPGRYIFALHNGDQLMIDDGEYDIPPLREAHLII